MIEDNQVLKCWTARDAWIVEAFLALTGELNLKRKSYAKLKGNF